MPNTPLSVEEVEEIWRTTKEHMVTRLCIAYAEEMAGNEYPARAWQSLLNRMKEGK